MRSARCCIGARDRSARLHGLDDLAVARVATNAVGADLQSAGLIDRAGEDRESRGLLDRHRFAGDAGLIDEGVAVDDRAVDWDPSARRDQDGLADFEARQTSISSTPSGRRTENRSEAKSARDRGLRCRPRETVMSSRTSATRTKRVMTSAVKNSPMPAAATMAMVMESSIVMRRARRFSKASFKIGQPPTTRAIAPIRLMARIGSQISNQTAAAAMTTKTIRAASCHSKPCSCSSSSSLSVRAQELRPAMPCQANLSYLCDLRRSPSELLARYFKYGLMAEVIEDHIRIHVINPARDEERRRGAEDLIEAVQSVV